MDSALVTYVPSSQTPSNYTSTALLTSIGLPTSLAPSFPSLLAERTPSVGHAASVREIGGRSVRHCYQYSSIRRGLVFRAADLIDARVRSPVEASQHWSEYLVLYRIPAAALIDEVVVLAGK